jgi:hypothetical protein
MLNREWIHWYCNSPCTWILSHNEDVYNTPISFFFLLRTIGESSTWSRLTCAWAFVENTLACRNISCFRHIHHMPLCTTKPHHNLVYSYTHCTATRWWCGLPYSPPTLIDVGHRWTVSINIGRNQWLSLAKPTLKVSLASRNRSLVPRTRKCGWAISNCIQHIHKRQRAPKTQIET